MRSLKDMVQDKIHSISTKRKHSTDMMSNTTYNPNLKNDDSASNTNNNKANDDSDSVEWHNFTVRELLELSQQNQWNDVHKDVTSLILSLSKYNSVKSKDSKPSQLSQTDEIKEEKMSESSALKIVT